jgi:hypothetical protein
MRRPRRRLILFLAGLLLLAGTALLASIGPRWPGVGDAVSWKTLPSATGPEEDESGKSPSPAPRTTGEAKNPPELRIDPETLAANGVKLTTLSPVLAPAERALPGRVLDPEPLIAAREALRNAAARLSAARTARAGAEAALSRDRALYHDHQNVAAATLEEAESAFASARAAETEAEAAMEALAAGARTRWGETLAHDLETGSALIDALISGRERLIALSWPAGEPLPTPLAPARFTLAPDAPPLLLAPIGPAASADPTSATRNLYYHGADPALLPGLNGTAYLPLGTPRPVFLIPPSSVVWWQGKAYVYRALGEGRFTRLPLGDREPSGYLLPAQGLSRLAIVSEGAAVLLSEEFRSSIDLGEGDEDDP